MRKLIRGTGLGLIAAVLTVSAAGSASAQTGESRLQLGAQIAVLRLSEFDTTSAGVGGRLGYELTPWASLEGEANFFGRERVEIDVMASSGPRLQLRYTRRRVEAFIGPKVGLKRERFGIFGKVRPGFATLSDRGIECAGEVCALVLIARPVYRTEFALDVGGVLEVYPTARTIARVDLGSTLIRHRSSAPPCGGCTTNNFSSRIGFGFRF